MDPLYLDDYNLEYLGEIKDLYSEGDYVRTFTFAFQYKEEKGLFGWKIADRKSYEKEKQKCLENYNKLLRNLDKYQIDYNISKNIDKRPVNHGGIPDRWMHVFWDVTISISKDRKPWFFELTRKLGYDSLLIRLKKLAGPWYKRIKDSTPAKRMADDLVWLIGNTIDYARENRMDSILIDSDFEKKGVKLYYYYGMYVPSYPDEYIAFGIRFRDYGYEDMNNEQLAALMAIYFEAAKTCCDKQEILLNEDYFVRKVFETSSGFRTQIILYLKPRPLRSW